MVLRTHINCLKKVKAHIERGSDGIFSVYMYEDSLDYSINGQGKTAEDAIRDFEAVYNDTRKFYREQGMPFTEVEFEYRYDFSALLASYAEVFTLVGLSRITGINKSQLSHYLNGTSCPSARTTARINEGVRNYASRLVQMTAV